MEIEVGAKIRVINSTADLIAWCNKTLTLDNPDFYKKERMGKWTGGTPRKIYLYETIGTDLILPFGCLQTLWDSYKTQCAFKGDFKPLERISYDSSINLRSYQKNAVEAILRAKNGIVVMPCGAGKTQTAIGAVAQIGGRALWLTHTQDLMNQSLNRAKAVLDIDPKTYGTITGGKVAIGSSITFATVQTLSKIDLSQYHDIWDVVVVDECQHCCGSPTRVTQFYKVLSGIKARYKIGLTATPKRADGLEQGMYALLGGKICEIKKDEIRQSLCPVEVRTIETGYQPDYNVVLAGDGTINYASLVDDLVSNEQRFEFVKGIIPHDGATLVLANRVEYLQRLNDSYSGRSLCLSTLGASKKAKETRKNALRQLNGGEIDCIFATYQLAKEGLDVPNLRHLVLATPEKDETTVTQAVGRVERRAEGKDKGIVYDLVDDFGMYKGWAKKRKGYYKKLEYEIF